MNQLLKDILSTMAIIRQSRTIYVVGSELVTGLCTYTTRRLLTLGLETLDLSNLDQALFMITWPTLHRRTARSSSHRIRETYREYRKVSRSREDSAESPSQIRT